MRECRSQCVWNKGTVKWRGHRDLLKCRVQVYFSCAYCAYVWWDWDERDRNTKLYGLLLYLLRNSQSMFFKVPKKDTRIYAHICFSIHLPTPCRSISCWILPACTSGAQEGHTTKTCSYICICLHLTPSCTRTSCTRASHNSVSCFALRL